MLTYDYKCNACASEFEARQGIKEVPYITCPACLEDSLQRVIGAPDFILNGTGYYYTDFREKT